MMDENEVMAAAVGRWRSRPDDEVLLIRVAFVAPTDPPEWRNQRNGLALH